MIRLKQPNANALEINYYIFAPDNEFALAAK